MKTHSLLRDAMEEAGMSQKALAQEAGVSESALSNILAGRRKPSVPMAEAILGILRSRTGRRRGLTLDDLFSATKKRGRAA